MLNNCNVKVMSWCPFCAFQAFSRNFIERTKEKERGKERVKEKEKERKTQQKKKKKGNDLERPGQRNGAAVYSSKQVQPDVSSDVSGAAGVNASLHRITERHRPASYPLSKNTIIRSEIHLSFKIQ